MPQKFRTKWQQLPELKDWLMEHKNNTTKAVCKFCKCELAAKLHDLYRHVKTEKHKTAAKPFASTRQMRLDFPRREELSHKQIAEARVVLFIAAHTATHNVDHLTNICNNSFKDSNNSGFKLHRTKCSLIITNVFGDYFRKTLINDVQDNPYSLIIDESTDIATKKMLGIIIRYFSSSQNKVVVTFLSLIEIESGKAVDIVTAIVALLQQYQLDINNLKGIGTDNASVMVGDYNGVYGILKSDYNLSKLCLIRCVCHSIQLALSKATEGTLPRNIDFFIRETYNWFSQSTNRQNAYKQIYNLINNGKDPLKIPKMCDTRWISIEPAVSAILSQWLELQSHFEIARRTESCYTSEVLYAMYIDKCVKLYLIFLQPVLQEVQKCNKLFESEKVDVTKLLEGLGNLIKSMCVKIVIPGRLTHFDYFKDSVEDKLDPKPYFGYSFETFCRNENIDPVTVTEIKLRCTNFVVKLISELRNRLPSNLSLLEELSTLCKEEALKVHKKSITKLAEQFFDDPLKISKIENQWSNLHTIKWCHTDNTEDFWKEINLYVDACEEKPFSDLMDLIKSALSLPHSNADVERLFSHMKIVKNRLRNRMLNKSVNAILHIRYGLKINNSCCDTYVLPDEVLKQLDSKKSYEHLSDDYIEIPLEN